MSVHSTVSIYCPLVWGQLGGRGCVWWWSYGSADGDWFTHMQAGQGWPQLGLPGRFSFSPTHLSSSSRLFWVYSPGVDRGARKQAERNMQVLLRSKLAHYHFYLILLAKESKKGWARKHSGKVLQGYLVKGGLDTRRGKNWVHESKLSQRWLLSFYSFYKLGYRNRDVSTTPS